MYSLQHPLCLPLTGQSSGTLPAATGLVVGVSCTETGTEEIADLVGWRSGRSLPSSLVRLEELGMRMAAQNKGSAQTKEPRMVQEQGKHAVQVDILGLEQGKYAVEQGR